MSPNTSDSVAIVIKHRADGQKACSAWEKDSALVPANQWLSVYAPKVIDRLRAYIPDLADDLVDQDVLAMQMASCNIDSLHVR